MAQEMGDHFTLSFKCCHLMQIRANILPLARLYVLIDLLDPDKHLGKKMRN